VSAAEDKTKMNSLDSERASVENGKKLDEVILLLKGQGEDAPGLLHKVAQHGRALYGTNGHDGLISRVAIMWRFHVWLLVTISAGIGGVLGFILKTLVEVFSKHP